MKLYMIRHGQTDWNRQHLLQGWTDIPLNENGRTLAAKTAGGLKDIPFDRVYTSPLIRAKETARLALGGRDIPTIEDRRIIEVGFGKLEGFSWSHDPESADGKRIREFFAHPESYRPAAGGESFQDVMDRTGAFLEDITHREELADKTILVSTHGCALRGLLNHKRPSFTLQDYWGSGVPDNCSVSIAEYTDGTLRLLEENVSFAGQ